MGVDPPMSIEEARRLVGMAIETVALPDPEDAVAWRAIRQLWTHGGEAALQCACELAQSALARDRGVAAAILGQLGVRPLGEPQGATFAQARFSALATMLENETDPQALRDILIAFSHLDDVRIVPLAIAFCGHHSHRVRYGVVQAISGYDDGDALDALIELSSDDDDLVRDWATFGLGSQTDADTPALREALLVRLRDREGDIDQEAIVGLARRGDLRVVPRIIEAIEALELSAPLFEAISALALPDFCDLLCAIPKEALVFHFANGRQRIDLEPHWHEALAACDCGERAK